MWILKLDSYGNVDSGGPGDPILYPGTWQKRYGGEKDERADSIQQTTDGGYIVAGENYLLVWMMMCGS